MKRVTDPWGIIGYVEGWKKYGFGFTRDGAGGWSVACGPIIFVRLTIGVGGVMIHLGRHRRVHLYSQSK